MTEAYDPYENAIAEWVNGILKQEFIEIIKVDTIELMNKIVNQSIEIYNTIRPHLSCEMNTPETMQKQNEIKPKSYKKVNLSKTFLLRFNTYVYLSINL